MKIIAVDYGIARTGLAICDKTETLAFPIGVLFEKNFNTCVKKVLEAVNQHKAERIVIGNPLNMDGTSSELSLKCQLFAEKLKKLTQLPIILWDERVTSIIANQYLKEMKVRGQKRKNTVDAVAATVILENYIKYKKNNETA